LNEATRAVVASDWARINQTYGKIVVTASEIRDKILGLKPLDIEGTLADGAAVVEPAAPELAEPTYDEGYVEGEEIYDPEFEASQGTFANPQYDSSEDGSADPTLTSEPTVAQARAAVREQRSLQRDLRQVVRALGELAKHPIVVAPPNVTVNIPAATATKRDVRRTATGFEISERPAEEVS
jgi:hypothetical protein